jgi:hypothetical protein
MQFTSHAESAAHSIAEAVVAIHAPVDAVNTSHAPAANDTDEAYPYPVNAIRMRDPYFTYELI